jgi:hypothetical protein
MDDKNRQKAVFCATTVQCWRLVTSVKLLAKPCSSLINIPLHYIRATEYIFVTDQGCEICLTANFKIELTFDLIEFSFLVWIFNLVGLHVVAYIQYVLNKCTAHKFNV